MPTYSFRRLGQPQAKGSSGWELNLEVPPSENQVSNTHVPTGSQSCSPLSQKSPWWSCWRVSRGPSLLALSPILGSRRHSHHSSFGLEERGTGRCWNFQMKKLLSFVKWGIVVSKLSPEGHYGGLQDRSWTVDPGTRLVVLSTSGQLLTSVNTLRVQPRQARAVSSGLVIQTSTHMYTHARRLPTCAHAPHVNTHTGTHTWKHTTHMSTRAHASTAGSCTRTTRVYTQARAMHGEGATRTHTCVAVRGS